MSREDDIQELVKQTVNIRSLNRYDGDRHENTYECPFCEEEIYLHGNDFSIDEDTAMKTIKHKQSCGYLIAKDLRK